MKTRLRILKLLIVLSCAFATTAVFGQTTYTWTNQAGGDIAIAANWDPNGLPNGGNPDQAQWDGRTTGPMTITSSTTSLPGTGFGTSGINLIFTANQISSVTFTSTASVFPGSAPYGLNGISIDAAAGTFTLGDPAGPGPGNTYLYNLFGRPAGGFHQFINNSVHTASINGGVRWQAGGGAQYTLDFDGTGNWVANNYLVNDNNSGMIIQKDGTGTFTWNPSGYLGNSGLGSPAITINSGTLVLVAPHPRLNNQAMVNFSIFDFNAPAQAQTLSGIISGTGEIRVSGGTLTLSGASDYTGETKLNGGELVVNGTENVGVSGPLGLAGTISFNGGALGFSVNNVFDYSSRFNTNASQAFSIDTGGQNVSFATGLVSSGGTLTKNGSGTLTLSGTCTYSGLTTINSGRVLFQGAKTGTGSITVADGAALAVAATGTQVTPNTLTVGSSAGATLGFNNVNSTTTAPLAAGTLSTAGTITININSGTFTVGQTYPLLTWTTGSAPAVSLGVLNGFIGNLSFAGNTLQLTIVATAYSWTGLNNGNWDTNTANNWMQNGAPAVFADGGPVLFDDTATGATNVTVASPVAPTTVTINNSTNAYSIASGGANNIWGSATLTKSGNGSLTLSGGANTYTGATTLSGGTLNVTSLANGGSPSDIGGASSAAANIVLDGGDLVYTGGGASIDRLFSLGTSGGTIDSSGTGALNLNNGGALGFSGVGPRLLTLTGSDTNDNTVAGTLANNGGATSVTKSGPGKWVLSGNNTHSGVTTISAGVLQIGAGGATGSPGTGNISDNGNLTFNRSGTLTYGGSISGSGSVTNNGSGTVVLTGNSSYTGGTTVNAGTLQLGNGGSGGLLDGTSPIQVNSLLIFKSTSQFTLGGFNAVISGTGNVWVQGSGLVKAFGNNTYTGWTTIDAGATFQPCEGNQGQLLTSAVTNNGTLKLVRQDFGPAVFGITNNIVGTGKVVKDVNNFNEGEVVLAGTNTYTGGTYIAGGGIVLGDAFTVGAGRIVGDVIFTNSTVNDTLRTLQFNYGFGDDLVFTNRILGNVVSPPAIPNAGRVIQQGPNVVTLTGDNTYPAGTTINAGTLQVGNGGTQGSIGTGAVIDNGILVFNRSDNVSCAAISGTGFLVKEGAGTLTLTSTNNPLTGDVTVSNGTLVVSGTLGGGLTVYAKANVNGPTLEVTNILNITGGTVGLGLNKSLGVTNITVLSQFIIASGATLKLTNTGPALVNGDKFYIFNVPVGVGSTITATGSGFDVINNLLVDGSITVTNVVPTVNTTPTNITFQVSGGNLTLSWPADHIGWRLQAQTNTLAAGLQPASNAWVEVTGSSTTNQVILPVAPNNGAVFFRMVYP